MPYPIVNMRRLLSRRLTAGMRVGACALMVTVLVIWMAWRALLHGVDFVSVLRFWLYVTLYVGLPGGLLHGSLFPQRSDPLLRLGEGMALGLAVHNLIYIMTKLGGIDGLFVYYPSVNLLLGGWWWLRRRHRRAATAIDIPLQVGHLLALMIVLLLVGMAFPPIRAASRSSSITFDTLWHTGNIAEMAHHWPLQNPRVAGEPFSYHLLSYAFPAAAAQVTGVAVADIVFRLSIALPGILLAMQLANAGHIILGSPIGGMLAALMILFHTDPGGLLPSVVGHFNSFLGVAIYGSITGLYGFILLVTLAMALHEWLAGGSRAHLVTLALLSLTSMWTRPPIMVAVIAGLAGLIGWRLLFERRFARRAGLALLIMGIAILPPIIYLSIERSAYVYSEVVRLVPGETIRSAPFYQHVANALFKGASTAAWLPWALLPLWLIGYFNLAGVGATAYVISHKSPIAESLLWMIMMTLAGLGAALVVAMEGKGQLAILYNGQIMLALLSGAWVAGLAWPRSRRHMPGLLALGILFIPLVIGLARNSGAGLRRDWQALHEPPDTLLEQYYAGLDWLRTQTPTDAVILSRHEAMLISVYAERRAYYESGIFTPQALKAGTYNAFPERSALQARFFTDPDEDLVSEMTASYGDVYLIVDNAWADGQYFRLRLSAEPLGGRPENLANLAALVYSNDAIQIYRLKGSTRSSPAG